MHGLLQDFTFALRLLRKRPGASLVIALTLGLGIGVNAAFFAAFSGMVLRPLPFEEPGELVSIHRADPETGESYLPISTADLFELADSGAVGGLEAYDFAAFNLRPEGLPERVRGAVVTAGLFPLLGVEPAEGRLFTAEEGKPGAPAVALLADDLWRRSYGADSEIVGRTITVDGESVEVVGVMPAGFGFPLYEELWMPIRVDRASASRETSSLSLVGRRFDGVGVDATEAALEARMAELRRRFPDEYRDQTVKVRDLREAWMPPVTQVAAFTMQGLASLVLLIVCANVANMVLAQGALRRQEMALRSALGASRTRLVRQGMAESLVLAGLGGVAGLLMTLWQGDWLTRLSAVPIPYWIRFEVDAPVMAFAVLITLVTGFGIGLVAASRGASPDVTEALKTARSDGTSAAGGWLRSALVVLEYAMAVVVVVGALLMVGAYERLQHADTGFAVAERMTLKLSLPDGAEGSRVEGLELVDRALESLRGLPEVVGVTATSFLPIENGPYYAARLEVEGRQDQVPGRGEGPKVTLQSVAEDYFETLDIGVLAGREFSASELEEGRPVTLVSAGLAARLWPGESAVGRRLRVASEGYPWLDVIGVAADVEPGEPLAGVDRRPAEQVYLPISLETGGERRLLSRAPVLIVATPAALEGLAPKVRLLLSERVPEVPVFDLRSMEQVLRQHYFAQHIWSRMFALIALVALGIAALGAYGVSAYAVSRRRREIGIRLSLGAEPRRLMAWVISRGAWQAALGLVCGLLVAIPMAGAMRGLLHGATLADPRLLGGVSALLASVALLATIFPARRAARVDPAVTLRGE